MTDTHDELIDWLRQLRPGEDTIYDEAATALQEMQDGVAEWMEIAADRHKHIQSLTAQNQRYRGTLQQVFQWDSYITDALEDWTSHDVTGEAVKRLREFRELQAEVKSIINGGCSSTKPDDDLILALLECSRELADRTSMSDTSANAALQLAREAIVKAKGATEWDPAWLTDANGGAE